MGLFGFLKDSMIDKAIVDLGRGLNKVGEEYHGISYNDVIKYIKAKDCKVITTSNDGWIMFECVVSGERYSVQLDRVATGGPGAFLSSKKI